MREGAVIPTAKEVAVWLGVRTWLDPPYDLHDVIKWLYAWPEGRPYPPLPEEADLVHALGGSFDKRWWTPGAPPPSLPRDLSPLTLFGPRSR